MTTRYADRRQADCDLRYYPVARAAHLERLRDMHPALFFYSEHRLDWDEELAASLPDVERLTFRKVLTRVWMNDYRCIEVPEPLAVVVLPRLVAIALVIKAKRLVGKDRGRKRLVFYAIENLDQVGKVHSRIRVPSVFVRWALNSMLSIVLSETKRAVFGTEGALRVYEAQMGERRWRRFTSESSVRLIPGLSKAAAGTTIVRDENTACFLGSFEIRKGIHLVLAAWPHVRKARPASKLVIVGHGPLLDDVRAFCAREGVVLIEDPPRAVIGQVLSRVHCTVLPSIRTATWREQIGLPILEALSAGCEIVTTAETGLAAWLREHGHRVLGAGVSAEGLAGAIVSALDDERSAETVRSALPHEDGRVEADRWLFGGSREGRGPVP